MTSQSTGKSTEPPSPRLQTGAAPARPGHGVWLSDLNLLRPDHGQPSTGVRVPLSRGCRPGCLHHGLAGRDVRCGPTCGPERASG
jgi:hypothetical protein